MVEFDPPCFLDSVAYRTGERHDVSARGATLVSDGECVLGGQRCPAAGDLLARLAFHSEALVVARVVDQPRRRQFDVAVFARRIARSIRWQRGSE